MPIARAVICRGAGDADVLDIADVPVREPGFSEVLVRVAAASLNRADLLQRRGLYKAPPGAPADILGLEYAGTVEKVGEGVTSIRVGDRVMGIVSGGAMATYVVVHERETLPVPDNLDLNEAAAVPEVFLTAYDALFTRGRLKLANSLLVHAVASGVGTAALQLALVSGARVIGTSRSKEKLDRCAAELGLQHGIFAEEGRFADDVLAITGRGADVIIDLVGAQYFGENIRAAAPKARIVFVGLLSGANASVSIDPLLRKRLHCIGTVLRTRPFEEKALLVQRFVRDVLPWLASGRVRPVVDAVMPMSEIREAHRRMEKNATFGKLVLAW